MSFIVLMLACADLNEASTSALTSEESPPSFTLSVTGYDIDEKGPMVAQLIQEFDADQGEYAPMPIAEAELSTDGHATITLPDDLTEAARFRLVVRERGEGLIGPVAALTRGIIIFSIDAAVAPEGWSVGVSEPAATVYRPLSRIRTSLNLEVRPELELGGPIEFVTDNTSEYGVVLEDEFGVIEGAVGLVEGGRWSLFVDGDLGSRDALRPVAYIESDGVLGFDPETEVRVGEACLNGEPVAAGWADVPMSVAEAVAIQSLRLRPGWTAYTAPSGTPRPIRTPESLVMRGSCG